MKKVIIVHRWDGNPKGDWYPWIGVELKRRGWVVSMPEMPNPHEPDMGAWVSALKEVAGEVDGNTYFVGHSIGCQTILRFLQTLPEDFRAGGGVFVAGWLHLNPAAIEKEEEYRIAKPWLDSPMEWERIRPHLPKSVAIFSDNDPYVPREDAKIFEEKLGSRILVEQGKGHMTEDDGIKALSRALNALLEMARD